MYLIEFLKKIIIPRSVRVKNFQPDPYQFELTPLNGDVSDWMQKYPVDDEKVEIYFALAELFRRRGEYDKAIAVHEAIAAADLKSYQEEDLLLEIAQDYYDAGILGHAEGILERVIRNTDATRSNAAFRLWLSILEREQEWARAIALVEQFGQPGAGGIRLVNLYCERALEMKAQGEWGSQVQLLKNARKLKVGVRASLMSAELTTAQNSLKESIKFYRDVLIRDPLRGDLVLSSLKHLSTVTNANSVLSDFLKGLYDIQPSVRILEVLIDIDLGMDTDYWRDQIEFHVKEGSSKKVFDYWLRGVANLDYQTRHVVSELVQANSLVQVDRHKCVQCGFLAEQMIWQCPRCDGWETLYSIYELKISKRASELR